jgi:hypothetical protein
MPIFLDILSPLSKNERKTPGVTLKKPRDSTVRHLAELKYDTGPSNPFISDLAHRRSRYECENQVFDLKMNRNPTCPILQWPASMMRS